MNQTQAIWIKDPLSILAEGAERGIVIRGDKIVELVGKGREPVTAHTAVYDAGAHVVLPGLINTHHHFYQTLTRALPAAMDRGLFPWLQALYPVWARLTPDSLNLGVTVAMSELLLSGCTTTTDHHYVFPGGLEDAVDIEVAAGFNSSSMGPKLVRKLESRGLIRVSRFQRFRLVEIVATGKQTARHPSMHADRPLVRRGARSASAMGLPSDRKPYVAR